MTATRAADGPHTNNGTPHGRTSITPHVVVSPAAKAITFYRDVFGATVEDTTQTGDVIVHAVLAFATGCITVSDPLGSYGLVAPTIDGPITYSLGLYVPNVDEVVARAIDSGAVVREPLSTFVSGDRYCSLRDPFGVRWSVMTRVVDLSPAESAARVAEWARSFSE